MKILLILAVISALVTLGTLVAGVTTMGKGGDAEKKGNKLMQMRVFFQALTIILVFLTAVTAAA
ncbi:hypothetical protein GCM10017044_01820 [Kordiimonas sediminis]|uniref:HIG1 domain-containing protein n=1 Tax=Kordiimonas sediminis TaxID=1735581 RepID=A0A919E216_9PROT|nr:twin transmembrane helix small protein [Kordiimonas sediminis]GHF11645.1 hypothetical protein GCM10017044_01820 [Kordiimonas sediminis]